MEIFIGVIKLMFKFEACYSPAIAAMVSECGAWGVSESGGGVLRWSLDKAF